MLSEKDYDVIDDDEEYKYLVRMPMDSVSEENVAKILKECENKQQELDVIKNTTIQQMWIKDLNKLQEVYNEYVEERRIATNGASNNGISNSNGKSTGKKKSVKKIQLEVEGEQEIIIPKKKFVKKSNK
jgi:DNA topoisomerase-2